MDEWQCYTIYPILPTLHKYVSDNLYKNEIFDNNDNQIANDVMRKVKTIDEIGNKTSNTRKNDFKL